MCHVSCARFNHNAPQVDLKVPKKVVLCPECHERVLGGHFARHMKTNHTNETFNCNQCGEKFKRIERLTSHQQKHCKKNPGLFPFKCLCNNTFKTEQKLINHKNSSRCVLQTTCKICKLKLPTKKELKMHMVTCQKGAEDHMGQEEDDVPVGNLMEGIEDEDGAEVGGSGDSGQGGSGDGGQRGSGDGRQRGSGDGLQGGSGDNFDNLLGDIDLSDDDGDYNQIVNDVGNISFSY